jgi:hypothetical protein
MTILTSYPTGNKQREMDMPKEKRGVKEVKIPFLTATPLKASASIGHNISGKLINTNKKLINVVYNDQERVSSLLGFQGQLVLEKIVELICDVKENENWPLSGIEINQTADVEGKDWQYVIINLVFDTEFVSAEKYLHRLYDKLDDLSSNFTEQDQDVLQRMIYLDVKTTLPIDHAG